MYNNFFIFPILPITYFESYLAKHSFRPKIEKTPERNLSISVVIPCFHEPDILKSLQTLCNCEKPESAAEIILVLNYPEDSDETVRKFHAQTIESIYQWQIAQKSWLPCHIIDAHSLPKKFAGVGLARKIGMDEAIYRFSLNNNEEGIICGFDADALVDKNYFKAIEEHFSNFPKTPGASIYFEHPFEELTDYKLKNGIIQYETHLRYLVHAIRYTGFPNAFHTVGSSFAVKAKWYVKQGGMNKFKAGEDFYFLNKIIQLGGYTEINSTRVIPQARVSNRVPFGTGASMIKWMEAGRDDFMTYPLEAFVPLKKLFENIETIYQHKQIPAQFINDNTLRKFLEENDYTAALGEILRNSSSVISFSKRFFTWFDAFKIVKYLNYASQEAYPKKPVKTEAAKLAGGKAILEISPELLLDLYRKCDRSGQILNPQQ